MIVLKFCYFTGTFILTDLDELLWDVLDGFLAIVDVLEEIGVVLFFMS